MLRKVSISWYKQRSGSYALKGITIVEDDRSYDSGSTFRDEDAEWVTATLNAEPDVEIAHGRGDEWSTEGYPAWVAKRREGYLVEDVPQSAISIERANATLLRYFLTQMIETIGPDSSEANARLQKLARDASTTLRSSDCGTHYSVDEAIAMLTKKPKKLPLARPEPRKK